MFRRFTKKRMLVALTAVAALVIAGAAVAYLTTVGSGSGSGSVTATTSALQLTPGGATSSDSVPALTKLGDSQTINVYAANNGTSPQALSSVKITVTPNDASSCPAGSFTVGSGSSNSDTVTSGVEVPTGGAATKIASDTVHFNDNSSAAQDSCVSGGYHIDLVQGS